MAVKSLNTLIKVQRRAIDELKREQVELERKRDALTQAYQHLSDELEKEIKLAGQYITMGNFFGNFADRTKEQQAFITAEVKKLDIELLALTGKLTEAFSELKKLEIARDNRLKEMAEIRRKKEEEQMDEIAMQQFIRKEINEN